MYNMKYFLGFVVGSAIVSGLTFKSRLAAFEAAVAREEKIIASKASN
jgi:hypothetical protein